MKTRAEITQAFRAKYEKLRSSFWEIGPLESNRLSRIGDVYVCDLGQNGRAAFVMYENSNVVEVHGGIYEFWKQKGGANGELGLPVSDETDYYGPDARPGDRVSKFENGIAVWRADTWQTELRNKSEANAPFDVIVKFREKYDLLKQAFPEVGEPIEPGIYRTPNGGWQCNYVNCAAITIRPADSEAHEVFGCICARWYQEGGAFDETYKPGWLGFPISGVETFLDFGDSNDRIVHFERSDIVWIAQNNETRIINSLISKQEFMEMFQRLHEKVVKIIVDQLGVDKDQISSKSSLVEDLHADDLALEEIIMAVEEEFGVEIPTISKETKVSCPFSSYPLAGFELSLSTGDIVGGIEQYLLEHSSPYADKVAEELGR